MIVYIILLIALIGCITIIILSKFLFRTQPDDSVKNAVELAKIFALLITAGVTFFFVDSVRIKKERDEFQFEIMKLFYEQAFTHKTENKLFLLNNLYNYRKNFVKEGTDLDVALVSLTKTLLDDSNVTENLLSPDNQELIASLKKDRSELISKSVPSIDELFGPLIKGDEKQIKKWKEENLVTLNLPYPLKLAWNPLKEITSVLVNKKVEPFLLDALQTIKDRNLEEHAQYFGGIFNIRMKRASTELSAHAYGIAIDINPDTNPLGRKGNMDPRIIDIFKSKGFIWGGDWSRPNPMHFEISPQVVIDWETRRQEILEK